MLKHRSLVVLTILKLLGGSLDHISMLLNLLCLNDSLVEQGISNYMLMPYGLTHRTQSNVVDTHTSTATWAHLLSNGTDPMCTC